MVVQQTKLKDAYIVKPSVHQDNRGFFLESYSQKKFAELGINTTFVQDNHSLSMQKGVVRGLHFQNPPHAQAKLVRVTRGAVYDVIVDLRTASPTFGLWEGFELSASNFLLLFIPRGFAHGFCTLEPNTEFQYKNDALYAPASEGGIRWDDPGLNIDWPVKNPILSGKDASLLFFNEFSSPF